MRQNVRFRDSDILHLKKNLKKSLTFLNTTTSNEILITWFLIFKKVNFCSLGAEFNWQAIGQAFSFQAAIPSWCVIPRQQCPAPPSLGDFAGLFCALSSSHTGFPAATKTQPANSRRRASGACRFLSSPHALDNTACSLTCWSLAQMSPQWGLLPQPYLKLQIWRQTYCYLSCLIFSIALKSPSNIII